MNDKVLLDELLLKSITEAQKCLLSGDRLSGGFTLDFRGRFHALRGGADNDSSMDETMKLVLERFLEQAQATRERFQSLRRDGADSGYREAGNWPMIHDNEQSIQEYNEYTSKLQ